MTRLISLIILGTLAFAADNADNKDICAGARDLKLVNGRIVTMDKRNTLAFEVTIQNGRFASGANCALVSK